MGKLSAVAVLTLLVTAALAAQGTPLAKEGMVRAAYLATNPAHAVKDPATGEARGVVIDLVRELGRMHAVKAMPIPLANPQAVIDAVRNGEAEVGFVAYNPERAGPVEFSKPYLLVNQTFIVRDDSPIRSIADIDRQGRKLGATRADSIALVSRTDTQTGPARAARGFKPERGLRHAEGGHDRRVRCKPTAAHGHVSRDEGLSAIA